MSAHETDPIWNVVVTVIDLVPAASAEEAIAKLAKRCSDRGLDVHVDGDVTQHAFESESGSAAVEEEIRADWGPRAPFYKLVDRTTPMRRW